MSRSTTTQVITKSFGRWPQTKRSLMLFRKVSILANFESHFRLLCTAAGESIFWGGKWRKNKRRWLIKTNEGSNSGGKCQMSSNKKESGRQDALFGGIRDRRRKPEDIDNSVTRLCFQLWALTTMKLCSIA